MDEFATLKSLAMPIADDTYTAKIKYVKESVGNTPLDCIDTVNGNNIFAKDERCNPFSHSVKDRTAAYMLTGPLERGEIDPFDDSDRVYIEASSGNLGIAYGVIGAHLGLKTHIVMPSVVGKTTYERVRESATYSEVVPSGYCPRGENDGAIKKVQDMWLEDPKYTWRNQYSSLDNVRAHEETTGPEIWRQADGKLTTLVLAPGTGGTIIGAARYLKSQNPEIEAIAVQPQKGHHIQGVRNFEESMKSTILKDNEYLIDGWVGVSDREAFEATAHLWDKGYYVGTSSGLNYAAARKIARDRKDVLIVTLFPDARTNSREIVENFLTSGKIRDVNGEVLPEYGVV